MKQSIDVGAYIWPAYSGKEPRNHLFWPDGEGEWQTVRLAQPKFEGHLWPRKPLLGYQDEADPQVMAQQIDLAVSHGVNVFIYDWYWFDCRPFQEQCLDDGFLGAPNSEKMKFYVMWANHDALPLWDRRQSHDKTVIWQGSVDEANFRAICERWMNQYFTRPNYYRIDGKPVAAIYDLPNFINGLGSVENARRALEWFKKEAEARGFGGVHLQLITRGIKKTFNFSGLDDGAKFSYTEMCRQLPFDSVTHYQYCHITNVARSYPEVMEDVRAEWDELVKTSPVPYHPHVSIGWDNNPRYIDFIPRIMTEATPANFEAALREAKALAEKTGAPLITVNSWNEWTEGSYLLPDSLYGYDFLNAVRKVVLEG